MRVQVLFKDNPTPLFLEMGPKIYDEIIRGVRSKRTETFIWGEDSNNLATFLLRSDSIIAISLVEEYAKEESEEGEEENDGPETQSFDTVEQLQRLITSVENSPKTTPKK